MNAKQIRIEEIRKEKGLSRAELSRQSGVPIRTIEDWEYRKNKTRDAYQLKAIALVLDCYIDDLLEPLENYMNK